MTRPVAPAWAAYHSGYHAGTGRRAGQVRRVHIAAPPDATRRRSTGPSAFCGVAAWPVTNSTPVLVSPRGPLPPGLTWCPKCLGIAAERLGVLDELARIVTAHLPDKTAHTEGRTP
ncbi:hypothetical protein LI90_4349 (plasmid) [Carbonactinospora thermoautotrophica]|uniref:Uncharacterized protein n=1 Tax=Carbonactinospora thermoautotrophica TaxID=1469144 RepID=A0A132MHR7_9ACTN|nr:hypothetical protein [Carbonactinospora thermoautotrophica]KWW97377.1 hypothetical protein LI90_4349 [Carbonactinospora thermoautotrophica]